MLEHLHGVVTPTDDGRDLGALETGEPELDHLSLVVIQLRDCTSQCCRFVVADDMLFRSWLAVRNPIGGVEIKGGFWRAGGAAVEIDDGVVGDREEPRTERAPLIGREAGKRLEQNRRGRVFGVVEVPYPQSAVTENRRGVAVIEDGKGGVMVGQRDQFLVIEIRHGHRSGAFHAVYLRDRLAGSRDLAW